MKKAVLMPILSKYCELIVNGKKNIEVRTTKPTIKTPFKSYIYCTKSEPYLYKKANTNYFYCLWRRGGDYEDRLLLGKVIGEFICDKIYNIDPHDDGYGVNQYINGWKADDGFDDCLTFEEKKAYLGNKKGCGWHISDLKTYDKPKELSEFWGNAKCGSAHTPFCWTCFVPCKWDADGEPIQPLTRAPQSWCYVEEL